MESIAKMKVLDLPVAFKICSKLEGIIPALEPSHALAYILKNKNKFKKNDIIIMNMCGRGDKDLFSISKKLNIKA